MAIKDILLHLDAGETARSTQEFATSLADITRAHMTAAAVVVDIPPPASELGNFAPDWDVGNTEAYLKIGELRLQAAEKAYARLAAAVPPEVQTEKVFIQAFQEKACDDFARLARHFDVSIISQGKAEFGETSRMILSKALFASGRPVFVIPSSHQGPAKLEKAMVCWDGGVQAARALAESLPLLARAARIEVVCVTSEAESRKNLPGFNITRHLSRHGIDATLRELPTADDAGSAILAHAMESGADYLVMGGYGHWRLSELILGGTTRTILASMRTPVFMAH
jgi:nucleotide-binding universal stress UspA family protein